MIRAYVAATGLAILFLVAPLVATAGPGDRFSATITPGVVQPPGIGSYTIRIQNQPGSVDGTQASIAVPTGFVVDEVLSPPQATIESGPCAGPSWNVALGPGTILLSAPDAASALCDHGTLAVTLNVLAGPLGDDTHVWTTSVSGGIEQFMAQSQPTLVVDGTPPETAITGTPPSFTGATASFSFSGNDGSGVGVSGVSGFECQLDGGGFASCASSKTYSGLSGGEHTFQVRALDAAQNVDQTPASVMWTVDVTAPDTTIQDQPPNPSASRSATFAFTGDDSGSGIAAFQCELDGGGFVTCASGTTYESLSDGSHTFQVRAVDGVGNVDATAASYPWEIDATSPPSPVITSAPSSPSGSSSATFTFSDGDATAGFRCALDGAAFSDCSSGSVTYAGLADGPHTFAVKAVDAVANESDLTNFGWSIDTVHPLVTLTDTPPLLTNRDSASFGFVSNKPASSYRCQLDGSGFTACTSPRLYTGLASGSHTFAVRAISLGDVLGPATAYTWIVDTVAPETSIASGPPSPSASSSATFTFTSSEPQSTFTCSLDGGGFAPCTSPKTYSGLGDGTHSVRVEAIDPAGNVDVTPATYSWRIEGVVLLPPDRTPPQNVRRLRRSVGYGVLQLRWRRPADADFDHVDVFVSTNKKSPPRTRVYTGGRQSYTNKRFKNGLYYKYLVVSYDHAENPSRGAPALVPPSVLLRSPGEGRVVKSPPVLRWSAVRKATFYNVQLYHRGKKILSAWPAKPRQALSRRWTYAGGRFSLRKGAYVWYVWPGFGPRAKARYGQLLGQSAFRVR